MTKKQKIRILVLGVTAFLIFFTTTSFFIPDKKEPKNMEGARAAIVEGLFGLPFIWDTLYIMPPQPIGVCGNDSRYDGITTPGELWRTLKENIAHPYYLSVGQDFDSVYTKGAKTIFVVHNGTVGFNRDSLPPQKPFYEILFPLVERNTIAVEAWQYGQNKAALQFRVRKGKGDIWNPESKVHRQP